MSFIGKICPILNEFVSNCSAQPHFKLRCVLRIHSLTKFSISQLSVVYYPIPKRKVAAVCSVKNENSEKKREKSYNLLHTTVITTKLKELLRKGNCAKFSYKSMAETDSVEKSITQDFQVNHAKFDLKK